MLDITSDFERANYLHSYYASSSIVSLLYCLCQPGSSRLDTGLPPVTVTPLFVGSMLVCRCAALYLVKSYITMGSLFISIAPFVYHSLYLCHPDPIPGLLYLAQSTSVPLYTLSE